MKSSKERIEAQLKQARQKVLEEKLANNTPMKNWWAGRANGLEAGLRISQEEITVLKARVAELDEIAFTLHCLNYKEELENK
jgi:hypothetical protein